MNLKDRIASLLGQTPRNNYNEIDIKFHKDCLHDEAGEHGKIVVSSKRLRLDHAAVSFVFPGMTEPPVLTARLMQDIWSAAESQGYVPHYILPLTYGVLAGEASEADRATAKHLYGDLADHIDRSKIPAVQREKRIHQRALKWARDHETVWTWSLNMPSEVTKELQDRLNARAVEIDTTGCTDERFNAELYAVFSAFVTALGGSQDSRDPARNLSTGEPVTMSVAERSLATVVRNWMIENSIVASWKLAQSLDVQHELSKRLNARALELNDLGFTKENFERELFKTFNFYVVELGQTVRGGSGTLLAGLDQVGGTLEMKQHPSRH